MHEITKLLSDIDGGDPRAAELLLPLVYEEPNWPLDGVTM